MASRADKYRVDEQTRTTVEKSWLQKAGTYLWNREKKTVLDRSASNWGKIGAFYFVYYIILGLFWYGCLSVFFTTIKDDFPTISLIRESYPLRTPGVWNFPQGADKTEMTPVISFDMSDPSSYSDIVTSINNILTDYSDLDTVYVSDSCTDNTGVDSPCSVNPTNLGDCDGVADPNYGYDTGEPCIFFGMNKMIGWAPVPFSSNPNVSQIDSRWSANDITINCVEKRDRDDGNPMDGAGSPEYFPAAGIPMGCFPYCGPSVNFTRAVVAVKFTGIHLNKNIRIACTVYAANIEPNIKTKVGVAIFALNIAS